MKVMLRWMSACLLGLATVPASSLPLPPPREELLDQQKAFFRALPNRLPAEDLSALEPLVDRDVKVFSDGSLRFSNRDEWFAYLRSFGSKTQNGPQGLTVSREAFFSTPDNDVIVLEFSWPIPPEGREDQISYHQDYDLQFVSYTLNEGALVRVNYGKRMRRYDQWLKDEAAGAPRSR